MSKFLIGDKVVPLPGVKLGVPTIGRGPWTVESTMTSKLGKPRFTLKEDVVGVSIGRKPYRSEDLWEHAKGLGVLQAPITQPMGMRIVPTDFGLEEQEPPMRVLPVDGRVCTACKRQMSAYLDSYYGTNAAAGQMCSTCRPRRA